MDELPLKRKIAAFIITLIAVPVLFVGTCVPVGFMAMAMDHGDSSAIAVFTIYGVLFVGTALWRVQATKNPGERWAIIIILALAAIWVGGWLAAHQFGLLR